MKPFLFILLLVACGCRTVRQTTTDNFNDVQRDSIRVEVRTEYHTDTVIVSVAGERQSMQTRDTVSILRGEHCTSSATWSGGELLHVLECEPYAVAAGVEQQVIYRDSVVYRDRTKTQHHSDIVEKSPSLFGRLQQWGFWLLLAAVGGRVAKKILWDD